MANLQVSLVTKSYGSKKLFEDVTVNLTAGKRYGLTGPNGAGKSTFMKILAGDLEPDTGSVARPEKTSVLRQDQFGYEDVRVLDVVLRGARRLWAAMSEKEQILALPQITDRNRILQTSKVNLVCRCSGTTNCSIKRHPTTCTIAKLNLNKMAILANAN